MSKREIDVEYEEPKEKVVVKKKGGFWGKFFAWFFGFLFGIIVTVGGIAGTGWYIFAKMKIDKGVGTINKLTGANIHYAEYIDGTYGQKTIKDLMGDVINATSKVSEGKGTLEDLNAISPLVTTLLEGEDGKGGLIATLKEYGIETTKEELMTKVIINKSGEKDPSTYLLDYLVDKAKGLHVSELLSLLDYPTNDLLDYVLTSGPSGSLTVGTLIDGEIGDFLKDYEIGQMLLKTSFVIPDDMQDFVYTLLFGEGYIVDGDGKVTAGEYPLTVGNVNEVLTRLYDVPLDALMPIDLDDTLMCILAYGGKDRFDGASGKAVMKQVYYTYDSATNKLFDADGKDVTANVKTNTLPTSATIEFIDGENTVSYYLKEDTTDGNITTLLAYADNTYANAVLFEKTTIQDLLAGNLMDNLFDKLTLGDVINIDVSNPNTMDILIKLKDTPINKLKDEIDTLTLGDVIEIDGDSNPILVKLKDTLIKDLESSIDDAIKDTKLGEVMEITTSSPLVLQNLADTKIKDLSSAFNTLTLDKVIEITESSHVVLQKIKEKGIKISELGSRLGEVIDDIKIGEIIEVGDNKILNAIKDFSISELPSKINTLKIGDIIDANGNKLLQAIAGFSIEELPSKINTLTIGSIIDVGNNKLLQAIQGFTIVNLSTQINTLKIQDVIDVGENKILGAIGGYTLEELPANINTAINGLQLKDVVTNIPADSILSNLADTKIGDLPTAINNLKIMDVFADKMTYLAFEHGDVQENVQVDETTTYAKAFVSRTGHIYQVLTNSDGKYYYVDTNGATVTEGAYIDRVGRLVNNEHRILIGTWGYLLTDHDGNTNGYTAPNEYTITNMDALIDNMTYNMESATLNDMHQDKVLHFQNLSLLTTKVHYKFLQYEVPYVYYQDKDGNYTNADGEIVYTYSKVDGVDTYVCTTDSSLVYTKSTYDFGGTHVECFVDKNGKPLIEYDIDLSTGTILSYEIQDLPNMKRKEYYGELTMTEMIDHLTMIIQNVPEN